MRLKSLSVLWMVCLSLWSCDSKPKAAAQFLILPSPVSFEVTGDSDLSPADVEGEFQDAKAHFVSAKSLSDFCLLYTSDAADE